MSKVLMWKHHCKVQGESSVAVGCTCDWCGAAQSSEVTYCEACGLMTIELHDGVCAPCRRRATTLEPMGVEAADVNVVAGFREVMA